MSPRFPILSFVKALHRRAMVSLTLLLQRLMIKTSLQNYFELKHLLALSLKQTGTLKWGPVQILSTKNSRDFKVVPKRMSDLRNYKFRILSLSLMVLVQLSQCLNISTFTLKTQQSKENKIMGWLTFMAPGTVCVIFYLTRNLGPMMEIYLNSLMLFTRMYSKTQHKPVKGHTLNQFLNLLFVHLVTITGLVFPPLFVLGFHWNNTCKISLTGYFFLRECQVSTSGATFKVNVLQYIVHGIVKITIFLGNMWMWYFAACGTMFMINVIHIIGPMMITNSIELLWRRIRIYRGLHNDAQIYRQIQIFNILCNSLQHDCLGVFMIGVMIFLSMSLGLLVKLGSSLDSGVVIVALLGIVIIDSGFTLLVILGGMVAVHTASEEILAEAKRLGTANLPRNIKMWTKKFWRSCDKVKIRFGDNNFLDKLTPLRCLDTSLNWTIQVLLLLRSGK